MKTPIDPSMLLDRNGNPVRVQKIPMSTGKRKFRKPNIDPKSNEVSVFERFKGSNSTKGRQFSF